ncbi:uncharacterized protein LOC122500449 [Leptopilina heterotoma]|uniref:uncharacterized protein LOC122500449 n=1 Tax=Leptopilina heterotoma TaxID=63436 RepID=UPI001CA84F06|nr:uncharacterized protein LOC122500449 [Leptopilina heterotoma]
MNSRRRRSGDFTSSLLEYNRTIEAENTEIDIYELNSMEIELEKKKMVNIKSNETISADTTIFQKVIELRSQLKTQQQNSPKIIKTYKNQGKIESISPISNVLNKISKTLELKQEKDNVQSRIETCRQEPSKLWNALTNFNRSLNSDKSGVQSHQKVLSRLSQEFHLSPAKFAEKLVTIIEESVMPSISDPKDYSGVSVHRMTQEFRKLCKFIEDESMPEWLITSDIQEEQIENQTIEFADETCLEELERFSSTPINRENGIREIETYQETPKGIFKFDSTPKSDKKQFNKARKNGRINDTNNSFEYWETMCNGVFLPQRGSPQKLRRSLSLPDSPVTRFNNIKSTCDRQMASLDDTAINESRIGYKSRNYRDITFSPKKLIKEKKCQPIEKKSIFHQNEANNEYSFNCEDDMDKSFLAELAQRRQRCFETAKIIMEIDKNDPTVTNNSEVKKTAELIAKLASPNKSLSLPSNNLDFLNTINHCMEYQDFLLKKRKSIFHILKNPVSSDSKLENSPELKKTETPISSVKSKAPIDTKVKIMEKKETTVPKRKFFFTPGKSPRNDAVKQKKEYFPQVESIYNSQTMANSLKSPRTPDVRKNLYDYVKSPIAEYIRGTDTKLVKNVQGKNNEWLLTPQPLGVSNESKGNRLTPLKSFQESSALKFNLSPLNKKHQDENNLRKEFQFPKVDYKPSSIQMINDDCEITSKNSGKRMKNLLKSCEKKIVIRHEGRVGVASPRNINDNGSGTLVDTSIQVKTIAKKTDSIRSRNVR